jgi:hypothetical protein
MVVQRVGKLAFMQSRFAQGPPVELAYFLPTIMRWLSYHRIITHVHEEARDIGAIVGSGHKP